MKAVKTDHVTKKIIMQNYEKERKKQKVKQSYEKRQIGKKDRQHAHAENERLQA